MNGQAQKIENGIWKMLRKMLTHNKSFFFPLGKHPRKTKTHVHAKLCTQKFMAILIMVIPYWKNPMSIIIWRDKQLSFCYLFLTSAHL